LDAYIAINAYTRQLTKAYTHVLSDDLMLDIQVWVEVPHWVGMRNLSNI